MKYFLDIVILLVAFFYVAVLLHSLYKPTTHKFCRTTDLVG